MKLAHEVGCQPLITVLAWVDRVGSPDATSSSLSSAASFRPPSMPDMRTAVLRLEMPPRWLMWQKSLIWRFSTTRSSINFSLEISVITVFHVACTTAAAGGQEPRQGEEDDLLVVSSCLEKRQACFEGVEKHSFLKKVKERKEHNVLFRRT